MAFNTALSSGILDVSKFYTDSFKQLIYSHLSFLRETYKNQVINATPHQGLVWQGDFYGLLAELRVSSAMYMVVAMVNGIDDSTDYDGKLLTFIVPSERDIVMLMARDKNIDSEPR